MKMVDFAFLEAINKAKASGYQNVAARLPDGKWLVVAIEELIKLQGWPMPAHGVVTPGKVCPTPPPKTVLKSKLVALYRMHSKGVRP